MAKRSRESFQKRAREKARQEKQAEKRAKRHTGSSDDEEPAAPADDLSRAEEDSLMQEFAILSARHQADQISTEQYEKERHRIFAELGLDSDE